LLFTIGRFGIALYLGHSTVASSFGGAGALVALLIWIYYSCAILFYGAEYVRAYHTRDGAPVEPKDTAVIVRKEIVEEPAPPNRAA
jgi:membrane protein